MTRAQLEKLADLYKRHLKLLENEPKRLSGQSIVVRQEYFVWGAKVRKLRSAIAKLEASR